MRISWHYLTKGDLDNFKLAQANIDHFGNTLVDGDKEAQKAFEKRSQPHPNYSKQDFVRWRVHQSFKKIE